ncbi:MAG: hypothetical protein WBD99_03105 [Thermodesulfobacteriota bacterium]
MSSYFELLSIDSTVAISTLSLEELGYLEEKKEKDKKAEVHDEGISKDRSQNRREEELKQK